MFTGHPTTIDGFEIPYNGPLFLTVLAIHVGAGLTCVVSALVSIFTNKKRGVHTIAGTVYFIGLCVVFATATQIAIVRWKEDYHLFILGGISFALGLTGRMFARRKGKKWTVYHISGMGLSYLVLIIAFYVDNGRFLPIWKNLDPILYWLLPLIVGVPALVITLLTHPLTKYYFRRS